MKYPFSQFGSAALIFPPLRTLPTPSLPGEWCNVGVRARMLGQHCSAVARNWGAIDTFLGLSIKHSTVGALGGKFPASQPEPLTAYMSILISMRTGYQAGYRVQSTSDLHQSLLTSTILSFLCKDGIGIQITVIIKLFLEYEK